MDVLLKLLAMPNLWLPSGSAHHLRHEKVDDWLMRNCALGMGVWVFTGVTVVAHELLVPRAVHGSFEANH